MKFLKIFLFIFLLNLSLDIYFNNAKEFYEFRMFTKPMVSILLGIYFYANSKHFRLKNRIIILLALVFFCIGDVILLEDTPFYSFLTGLFLFLVGLLLYSLYLYRETTYDIDRLLPFLAVSLLIALTLIYLMYDGLDYMLVPVMIYISVVLNLMKIAYLRPKNVNNLSFILVFGGTVLFTIAQTIIGLNSFYKAIPNKDVLIMPFYGISQLMIIVGILHTKYTEHHYEITAKN